MAQAKLPPYVNWREGRPRFIPDAATRELGFKGEDLRAGRDGEWFTFEAADTWGWTRYAEILGKRGYAADQVAELVAAKRGGQTVVMKPAAATAVGAAPAAPVRKTVEHLLVDWMASGHFENDLSKAAQESYRKQVNAVIYQPETRTDAAERRKRERAAELLGLPKPERARELFAQMNVSAIGKPELRMFYDHLCEQRGEYMAVGCIAAFSAAFTWGQESTRWRLKANPRHGMDFERPEGRVMLIPVDEFKQVVAAADLLDMASVGDAQYLGLFTGQRQTDRLAMVDQGLIDGRRHLLQSKTGVLVKIKEAPQLRTRLEATRARAAAVKLRSGTRCDAIVVDEATGLPYNDSTYRKRYGKCRRGAVHGIIRIDGQLIIADPAELGYTPDPHNTNLDWVLKPMPSFADKRDQDLRDTCVILLRRSGNDVLDICDITGHSYKSVQTVIDHYLGRDATRADNAIDKLAAFIAKEGMA